MNGIIDRINVGDGVLRDEVVRTGLESAARLVMADNTNLSLGPNATIKLDRTVFNDEHTAPWDRNRSGEYWFAWSSRAMTRGEADRHSAHVQIPSFRGARATSEPGISRFPDVQLHI